MKKRLIDGPWGFWHGLLVLLAFVLVYAAASAAHMEWVRATVGFEAYLGDGPRLPPKLLITNQIIKAAALAGVVWLIALRPLKLDWRAVGFRPCAAPWMAAAVLVALGAFAANLALAKTMMTALPQWADLAAPRYVWGDAPASQMLFLLGFTILVTPVAEELFFRGFLFQWMATHHPAWAAIVFSSMMFGASHLVPSQAIIAALTSLLIIGLYIGSRSLWPCIVCHGLHNALGVLMGLASAEGMLPQWLMPPSGG